MNAEAQPDQTNSWTSPTSGFWENLNWSQGGYPGTNQEILFTNANSKLLTIGTNTAANFPQTLNVEALTVSSPTNASNQLFMDHAGLQAPLVIGGDTREGRLFVASNSTFVMLSSALNVHVQAAGPFSPFNIPASYGAFSIGGTFTESEGSLVTANFLNVGDVGPGIFNLTNSTLSVPFYEIVGGFPSTFNQHGGTNITAALILTNSGEYDLYDGSLVLQSSSLSSQYDAQYAQQITFMGGNFNQWGGNVSAGLLFQSGGTYQLAGGTLLLNGGLTGGLTLSGGFLSASNLDMVGGNLLQTGGTNFAGPIMIHGGGATGPGGGYTLSGGILSASSLHVGNWGGVNPSQITGYSFNQSGGFHTNGVITVEGAETSNNDIAGSFYNLSGGTLVAASLNLDLGTLNQSGGTNVVGTVALNEAGICKLSGGWLSAQSIQLNGPLWYGAIGGFFQSGGTNQVNNLSLSNAETYQLSGGLLSAQNIVGTGGSQFIHSGGKLNHTSILALDNGIWQEQTGGQQFGQLQLGAGTNSILQLPASACVLQFADSSSVAWSSGGVLTIQNWNGSLAGGGSQQILFGNNASALTAQQLAQIQFSNPAGVNAGTYAAKILSNGEIVPSTGATPQVTNTTPIPAPFFTGQDALGSDWYFLAQNTNQAFGYYVLANFPYVYHLDLGWEYFMDAGNAQRGGYFYDFADNVFFYTEPGLFPYLYDFNRKTWLFYSPQSGATDRYTSSPRWFYDLSAQVWVNNL